MKIELKNVKHYPALSQETNAYSAALYVDGRRIGEVSNAGHGGPDEFHGDYAAYEKANNWVKLNRPAREVTFHGETVTIKPNLEEVCGDLLQRALQKKDMQRILRSKILFVEGGNLMQVGWRGVRKLEQAHLERFKHQYPGVVPLNNMGEDEALDLYIKHG